MKTLANITLFLLALVAMAVAAAAALYLLFIAMVYAWWHFGEAGFYAAVILDAVLLIGFTVWAWRS